MSVDVVRSYWQGTSREGLPLKLSPALRRGETLAQAVVDVGNIVFADLDMGVLEAVRLDTSFLRDRQPDTYAGLTVGGPGEVLGMHGTAYKETL